MSGAPRPPLSLTWVWMKIFRRNFRQIYRRIFRPASQCASLPKLSQFQRFRPYSLPSESETFPGSQCEVTEIKTDAFRKGLNERYRTGTAQYRLLLCSLEVIYCKLLKTYQSQRWLFPSVFSHKAKWLTHVLDAYDTYQSWFDSRANLWSSGFWSDTKQKQHFQEEIHFSTALIFGLAMNSTSTAQTLTLQNTEIWYDKRRCSFANRRFKIAN